MSIVQRIVTKFEQSGDIAATANHLTDLAGKAVQAARAFKEMAVEGEKLSNMRAAFEQLGGTADTLNKMREATKNLVPDSTLVKVHNMAESFGIGTANIDQFAKIALGASKMLGTDVEKNIDDLFTGLARGSKMIIDNLGITMRGAAVYEAEYAAKHGLNVKTLTEAQKKLAFQYEVVRGAQKQLNAADMESMDSVQKLTVMYDNLKDDVLQGLAYVIDKEVHAFGQLDDVMRSAQSTTREWMGDIIGFENATWDSLKATRELLKGVRDLRKERVLAEQTRKSNIKADLDATYQFQLEFAAAERITNQLKDSSLARVANTAEIWAMRAALDEATDETDKAEKSTRRHTAALVERAQALSDMDNALGRITRAIGAPGGAESGGFGSVLFNSTEIALVDAGVQAILNGMDVVQERHEALVNIGTMLQDRYANAFINSGAMIGRVYDTMIQQSESFKVAKEAEAMATRQSVSGVAGVVNQNLGMFIKSEGLKAKIGALIEIGRAAADFATGNFVGGAAHSFAAAKFWIAARAAKAGKGGSGATTARNASSGASRRSTAPRVAPQRAQGRSARTQTAVQVFQFGTGRTGAAIAEAMNAEAQRRSGVALNPSLVKRPGRAGL